MEKAEFFAEIKELRKILEWLRTHLAKGGLDGKTIGRMELALEEAIANVIEHGNKGKIEIGVEWRESGVAVILKDWGSPFDPLTEGPEVDLGASMNERKVGGLGIYLMKQVMDELVYARVDQANVLTLFKRFSRKK